MPLNEYNRDQLNTLILVRSHLKKQPTSLVEHIKEISAPYMVFRRKVKTFHEKYLSDICTAKCFEGNESACCNREGIATFFADFVINTVYAPEHELDLIKKTLNRKMTGNKCVYLTEKGCLWQYKPIVCEMFLCDHAKKSLKQKGESLYLDWKELRQEEKKFTWPDRPVLFDDLEKIFIKENMESPLMYFHKSPGLLKIKSKWTCTCLQ